MVVSQLLVAAGLVAISMTGLKAGLPTLGILALVVAFSSSTQDIVVDAWRIEAANDSDELGLLSAAYQFGYRVAVLVSEAVILIAANHWGWRISYSVRPRRAYTGYPQMNRISPGTGSYLFISAPGIRR